jgi:hypothetical protein
MPNEAGPYRPTGFHVMPLMDFDVPKLRELASLGLAMGKPGQSEFRPRHRKVPRTMD